MEITCPSCGKVNAAPPCQRCACDLEPLFAIRRAAQHALGDAASHLRNGQAAEACELAAHSWELRHSAEAARLAFLASLALGDFAAAWPWRNLAAGFDKAS